LEKLINVRLVTIIVKILVLELFATMTSGNVTGTTIATMARMKMIAKMIQVVKKMNLNVLV